MVANLRQRNTLQFQYFWDFNKYLRAIFSQLSFENFWLYLSGEAAETRIKNMLVCHHSGLFFRVHLAGRKKNHFLSFEMEKIALILIYNIFVTKNFFSGMNIKKFFLPAHFL